MGKAFYVEVDTLDSEGGTVTPSASQTKPASGFGHAQP